MRDRVDSTTSMKYTVVIEKGVSATLRSVCVFVCVQMYDVCMRVRVGADVHWV